MIYNAREPEMGADGLLHTAPIRTAAEAIGELEHIFEMIGYEESQGDLWLGHPLTQVLDYLYAITS